MYEELTWYLPILRRKPGDKYIRKFTDAVLAFAEAHEELKDAESPRSGADSSVLDGPAAVARIAAAVQDEHAGDGSALDPFANGFITDLLARLNEIDIRDSRRDMILLTVESTSGYTAPEHAYRDEIRIARDRIDYAYEPRIETGTNPPRKWSCRLGAEHWQTWEELITAVTEILHRGAVSGMFDVGTRTFTVTFADGTEEKRVFYLSSFAFAECFALIKKLLPPDAEIPAGIRSREDELRGKENRS